MRVGSLWVLPLVVGLLACGARAACAQTPPAVLAVESLKPALDAIAAGWTTRGGKPATLSYCAANLMASQIAGGAPPDVVISDDAAAMDGLAKAGLIASQTRRAIIGNDLVLIAPADAAATLKIASGFDLAHAVGDGKLAFCEPASCVAGRLARQSLEALKVWNAAQPKIAPTPDDQATLSMVARGEARFGIVFSAEAKADPKVRILDVFPASTYEVVRFAVALIKTSTNAEAPAFIAALRSGRSTKILTGLGYAVLR